MARYIAIADGNLTTAATWGTVDTPVQNSSAASTNTTTSVVYNGTAFALTNLAVVDGVLLMLNRLSTTGTFTVSLSQDSGATAVRTVTVNCSDIPPNATAMFFKFGSTITGDGVAHWKVGVNSSTNATVTVYRSGTAADWFRWFRTTATAAPVAADEMRIAGEWTAAATTTTRTVTMNETATTQYGTMEIGQGGTVTYGTTAATNYVLRLNGLSIVWSGGTLNIGTTGTPIPRGSTAVLEMVCASEGQFGWQFRAGSTVTGQGLSRTSGKTAMRCLLNANAAAAATSLSVDTDTGWLNGDEIAIASTTITASQGERRTLTSDAGASTLAVAALTNAHSGTSPTQGEVMLLTQSVKIRGTSTTNTSWIFIEAGASVDFDWVEFSALSSATTNQRGIEISCVAGNTCTFNNCVVKDCLKTAFQFAAATHGGWALNDINIANCGQTTNWQSIAIAATTDTTWVLNNIYIYAGGNQFGAALLLSDLNGTISNININSGGCGMGIQCADGTITPWSINTFNIHSNQCGSGTGPLHITVGSTKNGTFTNFSIWRNALASAGAIMFPANAHVHNLLFDTGKIFGHNAWYGILLRTNPICTGAITFRNVTLAADTTSGQAGGFVVDANGAGTDTTVDWRFENCTFGGGGGIFTTHSTADFVFGTAAGSQYYFTIKLINCLLASTEVSVTLSTVIPGSYIASLNHDKSVNHKIWTKYGNILYETGTVDVSPSIKITPLDAANKIDSSGFQRGHGFLVPVDSGQSANIFVKVQKDGSYNGNAPRLILKRNDALGITSDTVLATFSAGSGTWQTISGTTAAASAAGVFECVVDCDGTAGNIFVDTWDAT